ncbi:unnamed protein product [Cuscuta epithymum]|uniref:WIYLD domain-containing protein n=1 Tax=Cuscuta epithymum TaxID=186058 RepID=A0AAV0F8T2_9ASTE|nr:unnamed protein product [Cuscuta epithymum]
MGPDSRKRIANAFRATKVLGISEEKVKPVLKRLLKLYNKNWDLIEEENYRSLLDAIFEYEEAEEARRAKSSICDAQECALEEDEVLNEEPERPLKRFRLRQQDGQPSPSSLGGTSRTRHDDGGDALLQGPPQPCDGQMDLKSKGKQRLSANPQSPNKSVGGHLLVKPNNEPGSSANKGGTSNATDKSCSLEIASLTCADVKASLNCNTAFGIPNFQMPSLDAVVKMLDDTYHKRYRDLDTQLSVIKVMEDVCQCFLQLAAQSSINNHSANE